MTCFDFYMLVVRHSQAHLQAKLAEYNYAAVKREYEVPHD